MAFLRDRPGVPFAVTCAYLLAHALPACTHALEVWAFGEGWARRANELGTGLLRRLAWLEGEVSEEGHLRGRWYALYMECSWRPVGGALASAGWERAPRLSTALSERAIMEYVRIQTGPPDHPAVDIIGCASEWPGTWTRGVEELMEILDISVDAWVGLVESIEAERFRAGARGAKARAAHRRKVAKLRDQQERPALRRIDEMWMRGEAQMDQDQARMWECATCPAAAAYDGPPPREFRAWVKLRVLGRWPGGCPVCGAEDGGWRHVVFHHVPGASSEEEALRLMSVPPAGVDFEHTVRTRAQLVGSTILGTGGPSQVLRRCTKFEAPVLAEEAPGGFCEACVVELADLVLDSALAPGVEGALEYVVDEAGSTGQP